ncbi:MAG: SDR family NAD(P)-dependent oxidoreductase [Hyphomicrobiales bacterium]
MTARSLEGRGAVVTGAGRGIGAAAAFALAHAGARVVVAARTASEIERIAGEIESRGGSAWAVAADVAVEADVRRLGVEARRTVGAVDLLVNAAGAAGSAPLHRVTLDDWNELLGANATSVFLCTREFAPEMASRGFGRVVAIASIAGLAGGRYIAAYAASKHAVIGLVRSVAAELGDRGVTVNAVCPGYVDSPMTERTLANVESRTGLSREAALAAVLGTTGQTRLVTVEEVAAEVVRLCGAAAAGVNGDAIVLNPGAGPT